MTSLGCDERARCCRWTTSLLAAHSLSHSTSSKVGTDTGSPLNFQNLSIHFIVIVVYYKIVSSTSFQAVTVSTKRCELHSRILRLTATRSVVSKTR